MTKTWKAKSWNIGDKNLEQFFDQDLESPEVSLMTKTWKAKFWTC